MSETARRAWCPTCNVVDHVSKGWRCLWCETVTMGGPGATRYPPVEAYKVSVPVIMLAHRLHAEGATVMEAAEATIARTGHTNLRGYVMTLRGSWAHFGLPLRSRSAAHRRRALQLRGSPCRPRYRADVETALLVQRYRELGSTVAVARDVGMSQQGAHKRLVRAGVITPRARAKPAKTPERMDAV